MMAACRIHHVVVSSGLKPDDPIALPKGEAFPDRGLIFVHGTHPSDRKAI